MSDSRRVPNAPSYLPNDLARTWKYSFKPGYSGRVADDHRIEDNLGGSLTSC